MIYIYQLGNGKMLVLDNDMISIEETGYPYPDCLLDVGKVFKGQEQVLEAILGYTISVPTEFISYCLTIEEPMSLKDFKNKVYLDNIGGGCPYNLRRYARNIFDGFTELGSLFINLVPEELLKDEFDVPEDNILEQYANILRLGKTLKVYKSNIFRKAFIMLQPIKNTELFYKLLNLAFHSIIDEQYLEKYKYCTEIKSSNGLGCLIFSIDTTYNHELMYFYIKITDVNLADGDIVINTNNENLEIEFQCKDDTLKEYYDSKPKFIGTFKRYDITNEF